MLNSKYLFKMFQLFMKLQKTFLCLLQNTKECAKPFSKADQSGLCTAEAINYKTGGGGIDSYWKIVLEVKNINERFYLMTSRWQQIKWVGLKNPGQVSREEVDVQLNKIYDKSSGKKWPVRMRACMCMRESERDWVSKVREYVCVWEREIKRERERRSEKWVGLRKRDSFGVSKIEERLLKHARVW